MKAMTQNTTFECHLDSSNRYRAGSCRVWPGALSCSKIGPVSDAAARPNESRTTMSAVEGKNLNLNYLPSAPLRGIAQGASAGMD